jgi:hypothetical protein
MFQAMLRFRNAARLLAMLAPLVSLACQTKDSATPASAQTPANAGNITLFDVNGNPLQPLATN